MHSPTVIVPPLFNRAPGEVLALGWLNDIDALHTIRQRIGAAARKTGWDVFTFHTMHNADHYFDSTITAQRDTWCHEGILSPARIVETKRRFASVHDYSRIEPRLIENLVFQSTLIEWTARRAGNIPLEFHVIGTGALAALVAFGAVTFDDAVDSALKIGVRWDAAVQCLVEECATRSGRPAQLEASRLRSDLISKVVEGREQFALAVAKEDLPKTVAPSRGFWFAPDASQDPFRVESTRDAELALDSLNLNSWQPGKVAVNGSVRGWLTSPLHPMAKTCRFRAKDYLLTTPQSIVAFVDDLTSAQAPVLALQPEVQNRLRLSRMKVTGP